MTQPLEEFLDIEDPAERAKAAEEAIAELQTLVNRLAKVRAGAIAELRILGFTISEIADKLGISRSRVAQLAPNVDEARSEFKERSTQPDQPAARKLASEIATRTLLDKSLASTKALDIALGQSKTHSAGLAAIERILAAGGARATTKDLDAALGQSSQTRSQAIDRILKSRPKSRPKPDEAKD